MAYKKDTDTDWIAKEKRELFCKATNSNRMVDPKTPLKQALDDAETTINKAFELYPDGKKDSSKEETFEFPTEATETKKKE